METCMRVGIVGSGRIGGNVGRLLARAGHDVLFSFSRDDDKLAKVAAAAGPRARTGSPRAAVEFADVVVLSVPWDAIDVALDAAGPLDGKVVVDTTNPFGSHGPVGLGQLTSAQYNQRRMPGARLVKAFNTLTAGFQAEAAGRTGDGRVAMFHVADDRDAGETVAGLIADAGFIPVSLGTLADSEPLEAPRRPGAVYGEEYREPQATAFAMLWRRLCSSGAGAPDGDTFVRRYIRAFATADYDVLQQMYDDDVVFYTPLAWGARGWEFVRTFIAEFHGAYPGLTVTLHDEFTNADASRACFRFVLHWHHTGTFFGNPPTGERGTMSETHSIRIRDGRIVEQWVGDNSFQLPYQELVQFGMDFPRDTPDPVPPILTVTAT
jgi:8-hydroxy-5-deazaflavin:NADPH oxidoreductase